MSAPTQALPADFAAVSERVEYWPAKLDEIQAFAQLNKPDRAAATIAGLYSALCADRATIQAAAPVLDALGGIRDVVECGDVAETNAHAAIVSLVEKRIYRLWGKAEEAAIAEQGKAHNKKLATMIGNGARFDVRLVKQFWDAARAVILAWPPTPWKKWLNLVRRERAALVDGTTASEPKAISNRVMLFRPDQSPWIDGKPTGTLLTNAQYKVVMTLLNAPETGLAKDALDKLSGHTEARQILNRLLAGDPRWKAVIPMPGKSHRGYRIL
jgi:hypothetical protein